MSDLVQILSENEEINNFYETSEDMKEVYESAVEATEIFHNYLPIFVHKYRDQFLGENLNETMKNIRTFAAAATSQYLSEIQGQLRVVANLVLQETATEMANMPTEDDYI